jgi:hypothetical protein
MCCFAHFCNPDEVAVPANSETNQALAMQRRHEHFTLRAGF